MPRRSEHPMRARTTSAPDAWTALVLRSMSIAELREESENTENTAVQREQLRRELMKRLRAKGNEQ